MVLDKKIIKSREVIREAFARWEPNIGIAFSGGKDSLAILGLVREMYGCIPCTAMFNDTTQLFPETYSYVDELVEQWGLELVLATPIFCYEDVEGERENCCWALKIEPSEWTMETEEWKACLVGIRWDEHPERSQEEYFSERENGIWRVHPILHWTEKEVWAYIKEQGFPYNPLYDKGYRSIGCTPCTIPISEDEAERAGRSQDKEEIMSRLRGWGYW